MSDIFKNSNPLDYFDVVREQLRYWPYTVHQIDDTLDVNLIEGRGKQLLFRAIHSKNLTAFAGSGLSMSYGRLSWREWQKEQKRVVERNAIAFDKLAKASLNWNKFLQSLLEPKLKMRNENEEQNKYFNEVKFLRAILWQKKNDRGVQYLPQRHRHNIWQWLRSQHRALEFAHHQIERLHHTFNLTQKSGGHFPGGEELPVKFEIAQQLHNQLRESTDLFLVPREEPAVDEGVLKNENLEKMLERSWTGTFQSQMKNAAPTSALAEFKKAIHSDKDTWQRGLEDYRKETARLPGPLPDNLDTSLNDFFVTKTAFETAFKEFANLLSRPEAYLSFERLAKSLLVDECPHALFLLRRGLLKDRDIDDPLVGDNEWGAKVRNMHRLESKLNVFSDTNQKRDIDGIRGNPDRYRVLSPFKLQVLRALIEEREVSTGIGDLWDGFWSNCAQQLANYDRRTRLAGDERVYVTPSSRFLLPLCLQFYQDPFKKLRVLDDPTGNFKLDEFFAKPKRSDFNSRRSIIADRFDSLSKIERDMGIHRYITTNYDFEIERYFQDQGYRNFPPPESSDLEMRQSKSSDDPNEFQTDKIGRSLIDRCFTAENASELTSFALDAYDPGAGVYHLHGRASKDERLVITERDYMKLYLTQDEHRQTIDEGISVAFSGAPLLFIGLGMEETDLLRPLRQFISNRDRTIGYTSIAMLPADKGMEARAKFSSALYLRYGVHTIFYGSGQIKLPGENKWRGIDWLHRIIALISGLQKEVELWSNVDVWTKEIGDKKPMRKREEVVDALYESVGKIGDDLAQAGISADTYALNTILGLPCSNKKPTLGKMLFDAHNRALKLTQVTPDSAEILNESLVFEPRLRTCYFTPTRPRNNVDNPHRDENKASIDGEVHLGFYTMLLDSILKIVVAMPDSIGSIKRKKDWSENLSAINLALDGLYGAMITACLNAALDGITKEKEAWWTTWQEPPPERVAEALATENSAKTTDPSFTFVRHRVDNSITGLEEAAEDEIQSEPLLDKKLDELEPRRLSNNNRTRVRSFDTFIAAMKCTFDRVSLTPDPKKRLLITVAARRGMGKGTFMSAFATKRGQRVYESAAWGRPKQSTFIAGKLFINLGFSPEIASTYDMMLDAIIKMIAILETRKREAERKQSINKARKKLKGDLTGLSRLASLSSILKRFGKASDLYAKRNKGKRPRLLINFLAVDLLFDRKQNTKNGEVGSILHFFFSKEVENCPVDLVFVGDDTCLGSPWSSVSVQPLRVRLERDQLRELAEENIQESIKTSKIEFDDIRAPCDYELDVQKLSMERHFIHFTRPVNAVSLLNDNFPVLATTMYFLNPPKSIGGATIDVDTWENVSKAIRKGRNLSDRSMRCIWARKDIPEPKQLAAIRGIVWKKCADAIGETLKSHASSHGIEIEESEPLSLILRKRLSDRHNVEDMHEWRDIRRNMGNSRFALTILLAAAEQIVIHAEDAKVGAERAQSFVRNTVAEVRGVGVERRDQMVLDVVIETHRQFHRIGDPDLDCELHMLILRHLGVIGTPLGSAVLVRLPEVREYFERLGIETATSRRRFLVRALTVLAHRGLVFRLEANPWLNKHHTSVDWPPALEFRYTLHRVVQNFSLSGLNTGTSDPIRNNSFAPTLYAVMPATGPGLSRETYRFLRKLMIGLSQYPDVAKADNSAEPWLFTTKDRSVRIQALRAALTLSRSIFSVAVVSRMSDQKPFGEGLQKRGYLETYRVRLRWIIRMAWELADPDEKTAFREQRTPFKKINALYRDEIVWIYNELGVISLTQGSLSDALGYLRQAADQNESIEGRSRNTPIFNHIDLNHAVVQIERGSFRSARTRLERVLIATNEQSLNLHYTALGYRCLLDHLSGVREGVSRGFKTAIEYFEEASESRAAALFLMHRGSFVAGTNPKRASRYIKRALNLAEINGHEDVRHRIELARIRTNSFWNPDTKYGTSDLKMILKVEEFSQRMAMWGLQVEALSLRSSLLLRQGETATAGRLQSRAMAIAKRHSLVLRLNSAMTAYAETLLVRGNQEGAMQFATKSLGMAKRIGYSLETARAQSILGKCG